MDDQCLERSHSYGSQASEGPANAGTDFLQSLQADQGMHVGSDLALPFSDAPSSGIELFGVGDVLDAELSLLGICREDDGDCGSLFDELGLSFAAC